MTDGGDKAPRKSNKPLGEDGQTPWWIGASQGVEVDPFSSKGAQLLEFDTPAALADGAVYSV